MKRLLLSVLALFLAATASTMAAPEKSPPDQLVVEVLIFSGRPNPVFVVTDPREIRELTALAGALPARSPNSAERAAAPAQLGYRGIAVKNRSVANADVDSFVVHRSQVQVKRKFAAQAKSTAEAAPEQRVDGNQALERRLLQLARAKGAIDDRLLAAIAQTP